MRFVALVALPAILGCASNAEIPTHLCPKVATYVFTTGAVQRYEVEGNLQVSFDGSHAALKPGGHDLPFRVRYKAHFENAIVESGSAGRPAMLERRTTRLTVDGEYLGERLSIDYDAERPESARYVGSEGDSSLLGFFRSWIEVPMQALVNEAGQVTFFVAELDRMVIKAGLMYRPIQVNVDSWITTESLALPLIHERIPLEFRMSPEGTVIENGRRVMGLAGKAEFSGSLSAPMEVRIPEETLQFTATGRAASKFDLTNGRLDDLLIDVCVDFKGEAPVPGGKGALVGTVTFVETQKLK